jgi:superfamily II DNA or RNA helicase
MEIPRVLTSKGYSIRKNTLTDLERLRIEKELTVAPTVNKKFAFAAADLSFKIYRESPERYYVPRQWGIEMFGEPQASVVPVGDPLRPELVFKGQPYDYQKDIVDKFVTAGGNGLICVPCGRGKTFMAIWTALRLGRRFVIVVDKEFLLQQWKGELESLVPGIKIGIIQQDKAGIEGFDCSIAMIQTVVSREFPQDTFKKFGFAIFDECHHLGASHFSKCLLKIQTKWMLGLSATPQRDDGLTKVFEWFLGKPVYWEKTRDPDPMVVVRPIYIDCKTPSYTDLPYDWRGEIVMARLLSQVVDCKERNETIAALIREIAADERRKILVLSERISHLEALEAMLGPSKYKMSYYIGGMKEEVRESGARDAQILLASYQMASEAMNIKKLNCVVMVSPRKKIEQSTGRILRIPAHQRTVPPLILDIVDSHQVYRSQWRKRAAYYRKCKYTIDSGKEEEVEDGSDIEIRAADENGCMIADD